MTYYRTPFIVALALSCSAAIAQDNGWRYKVDSSGTFDRIVVASKNALSGHDSLGRKSDKLRGELTVACLPWGAMVTVTIPDLAHPFSFFTPDHATFYERKVLTFVGRASSKLHALKGYLTLRETGVLFEGVDAEAIVAVIASASSDFQIAYGIQREPGFVSLDFSTTNFADSAAKLSCLK